MSGRIVTEKYINDLGGRYLSSASNHLELIVQNSDFIQALGSDRVYCPTFAERSSIDSYYASVYTLSGGTFRLLSGLYVYVPTRVYSGQSGTLYSIASGDFVPEATITFNMLGADHTCATKLDAINAGCSVSGLDSYTTNQLIPTASVTGPGKATVSYNGYYVDADEAIKSTKYSPSYNTRGSFGAYATEFPDPDDQTEAGCNQVYTHVIGTTCTITKAPQPEEDIVAVDILQVEIVSNSSGKVLASGSLPLSFTLTENCWARIHALPYTLTSQPPTFKYSEGSDELTLADLNFGKVYLVPSSASTSGQLLFQKSSGQGQLGTASVNNTLLDKYIYFYADSYLALATPPVLLDEAEKMYPLVQANAKESSPGTPSTQIQLFASVHEYWFSFPEDLPLDRYYKVVWSLKDCRTVLEVPEYEPEQVDRVLTILNKGVGTVTVNGVAYTKPITYTDETRVTIKWPQYKQVVDAEVDIMYRTDTYTVTDSISLSVRMSDTTVTLTPKPVICEYTTVTQTALSPGSTWESGVSIKSNLWNSSRSLYEIEGSTTNVATSNTKSIFTSNKYVTSVSCFSSKNSGTYSVPSACFSSCSGLTSATFSVPTSISYGDMAFYKCTALKTITLTDNVTSFGVSCFANSGLTEFTCPSKVTSIPNTMCYSCMSLTKADLSKATSLTSIGEDAFSAGTSYVPVDNTLFAYDVSSLKFVSLPASVSSVGAKAFANNYLLDTIQMNPVYGGYLSGKNKFLFNVDSNQKNKMTYINNRVFSFCQGLTYVELPKSITSLYGYAFYSTPLLNNFQSPGLTYINNDAFGNSWCERFDSKLSSCTKVGNLYKYEGTEGFYFSSVSNVGSSGCTTEYPFEIYVKPDKNADKYILYKLHKRQFGLASQMATQVNVTPLSTTLSISPFAYANVDYALDKFSATPSKISRASLASGRFQGEHVNMSACSQLWAIGDYAFYNSFISKVTFPTSGSVKQIYKGVFRECPRLGLIPNFELQKITYIYDELFLDCSSLYASKEGSDTEPGGLYLPSTVTSIGAFAFKNCKKIQQFPNIHTCKITSIGESAFQNCFSKDTVEFPSALGVILGAIAGVALSFVIGPAALAAVPYLAVMAGLAGGGIGAGTTVSLKKDKQTRYTDLVLPYTTLLGKSAFEGCTYLKSIILGPNMTAIPDKCFKDVICLQTIAFTSGLDGENYPLVPGKIKTIGAQAFKNCQALSRASINSLLPAVETIKEQAFMGIGVGDDPAEEYIVFPKCLKKLEKQSLDIKFGARFIFLNNTPPANVDSNVFGDTLASRIQFVVPKGCMNNYIGVFPKCKSNNCKEFEWTDELKEQLTNRGYSV